MEQTFGAWLRKMRELSGKSMGDLARHLDVSVAFISDVEKDRRSPLTPQRILAAAEFLDGDPAELLMAAAKTKGAFHLNAEEASPKKMAVGAALMRGWTELDDPSLDQINEIITRKVGK